MLDRFSATAGVACLALLLSLTPAEADAQGLAPGPYETLPFDDAYIVEAFTDLRPNTADIADWTGWTSNVWESPNAYNNHGGTDFSVGTGTPIYAITTGTVIEVENGVPENTYPNGKYYGNFVKIQPAGLSPLGEQLTVLTAHMLPNIVVSVNQHVDEGQLIGYSDNTGNSTSEHCHVESAISAGGAVQCGFYNAHYKYPIMLNHNAKVRVGHVLRVKANNVPVRSDRFETSPQVTTVHQDQLLYASFAKRGFYRVFIPNDPVNRSAWVRAMDVDDVLSGTVIQPLPDAGAYVHSTQLATKYSIRNAPNVLAPEVGKIFWAGGRFVADDERPGGWFHIAVPGATALSGWVQANNRMVVYPQLKNPTIDLAQAPNDQFPMVNNFTQVGPLDYGRPKFDRRGVVNFSPAAPGGDGKALLLTDHGNTGSGVYETVSYGRPEQRDYYVEAQVYFRYRPSYPNVNFAGSAYENYGIFLRDDGFGGFDETFEGMGNSYLMFYNSKTGNLFCGKSMDAVETNFLASPPTFTTDGWHKMRIEAEGTQIRYYLDGQLQVSRTDTSFISGLSGMGYTARLGAYPAARGAYFDNFIADVIPGTDVQDWALYK